MYQDNIRLLRGCTPRPCGHGKPTGLRLITYCLLLIACLFCACSSDEDPSPATSSDDANVEVTFTLVLSDATGTRADETWGADYSANDDEGTMEENRIENLQVYFYDEQGNFLKKVDEVGYTPTVANMKAYRYEGTFRAEELGLTPTEPEGDVYSFSGKVLVLANCPDYTPEAGATLSEQTLTSLTYTFNPSEATAIPMWGIATVSGISLRPGMSAEFGYIDMLRAMAKIEVAPSAQFTTSGFRIANVALTQYNTTGLCLPTGASTASTTTEIMKEGGMNIPQGATLSTALTFKQGDSWYIYVPEMETLGNSDTYIDITIAYSTATERERLFFADYDNETRTVKTVTESTYNLVRNHYWRYVLSKTSETRVVSVEVMPWARYNHDDISM